MGEDRLNVTAHAASLGLEPRMLIGLLETMCTKSRLDLQDLLTALDRGDRGHVRESAHSIRGAAAGLALGALAELAAKIEDQAQTAAAAEIRDAAAIAGGEIEEIEATLADTRR